MKNIYWIIGMLYHYITIFLYKIVIILVRHMKYDYRNVSKKNNIIYSLKNFKIKLSDS